MNMLVWLALLSSVAHVYGCSRIVAQHVNITHAEQLARKWASHALPVLSSVIDDATFSKDNPDCAHGVEYTTTSETGQRRPRCRFLRHMNLAHGTHELPQRVVRAVEPPASTLRPQWFSLLEELPICGLRNRGVKLIGVNDTEEGADGWKYVCGVDTMRASTHRPLNIISIGSNDNWVFEEAAARHFRRRRIRVYTLDCTVSKLHVPAQLVPQVTFHRVCIDSVDREPPRGGPVRTWRWPTLLRELRQRDGLTGPVDLLKIDAEGYEYGFLPDLFGGAVGGSRNMDMPLQILMELHLATGNEGPGLHGTRLRSFGEVLALALLWHQAGYRLTRRIDNGAETYPYSAELTLLRVAGCHL